MTIFTGPGSGARLAVLGGGIALVLALGVTPAHAADTSPASSNFAPSSDGFSFQNYSTAPADEGALPLETLTAADAFNMYGAKACDNADATASNCVPNATVAAWLQGINKSGTGGHCFGMAALAQLLFNGTQNPSDISSAYTANQSTFSLVTPPASTNSAANIAALTQATALRHDLNYWWASQFGADFAGDTVSPRDAINTLSTAFASSPNRTPYLLSFNDHTITPIGVAAGSTPGSYTIQVYDNNFSGETMNVNVNATANTFSYNGDGSDPGYSWSGTGADGNLALTQLSEIQFPACMAGTCNSSEQDDDSDLILRRLSGIPSKTGIGMRLTTLGGRALPQRVRYGSQARVTASINSPARLKRYRVVLSNPSGRGENVSLTSFGGRATAGFKSLYIKPRSSLVVVVDRAQGNLRTSGAARLNAFGIATYPKADYRLDVLHMRSARGDWRPAMGVSFALNASSGSARIWNHGRVRQVVQVRVQRTWTGRDGIAKKSVRTRVIPVSPGRAGVLKYA